MSGGITSGAFIT